MTTAEFCTVTDNYFNLLLQEITLFNTEAVRPANQKPLDGNNNVDECYAHNLNPGSRRLTFNG